MFEAIAKPMASALAFFYELVPNYGVAIVLLTLAVMLLLTPFTIKSTRSMLAMQRLQPEMKRLQQQHKNDRQALNEAMMAFYKEHNVNPLSGCLPMLLQMPVFFALYEAIRGLTSNPPKHLSESSALFKSLCPDYSSLADACANGARGFAVEMKVLGMDLAKSVGSDHGSFANALPFYVLILLTTATQYYQQRQISNRNPQAAMANPQMQMMQKFFPLIFLVIYINIPAAVVVYFLTSNLLRIAQQGAMWRWDPKLAREVQSDINEVESRTKVIDAQATRISKGQNPKGQSVKGQSVKGQSVKGQSVKGRETTPALGKGGGKGGTGQSPNGRPPNGKDTSNGKDNGAGNGASKPPAGKAGSGDTSQGQGKPPGRATGAGPASRQRGRDRRGR